MSPSLSFQATVTPNSGIIGSHFTYTITGVSSHPIDWKPINFQPKWAPFYEISRQFQAQSINGQFIGTWTFQLTHFERHATQIPTQSIQINTQSAPQPLPAIAIGYQTASENKTIAFQPLPPRELPVPWGTVLIIGILGLVAVWVLIRFIQRYQNRESVTSPPSEPVFSKDPDSDAWAAIAQLPPVLPETGADALYSEMSDIVRTYVGAKCQTHLFECTTSEILLVIRPQLPPPITRKIRQVLQDCDRVKFGKQTPTPMQYTQTIDHIKQILMQMGPNHAPR